MAVALLPTISTATPIRNQTNYKVWGKQKTMAIVSQGALQLVLQEIKDGVTYPDFWANRYGEDEQEQAVQTEEEKQEEKTAQA